MKRLSKMTLALCALLPAAPAVLAQDVQALRTRSLAATCASCHGTDGRAVAGTAVPGLAGMPAAQIVERMKAFQRGELSPTVMHQIAKGYNDAQIQQLANYFAGQKP